MADNINLNGPYDTKVPGYNESADIQKALKLFLYGTETPPATQSAIQSNSLAGHLKALQTGIDDLNAQGIGSEVTSTEPTGVPDGFIWLDPTVGLANSVQYAVSSYTSTPPASPSVGMLWVDSASSPLNMFVWSGTAWREIGA